MSEGSILWRRLDAPGHEASRLRFDGDRPVLEGTAVFTEGAVSCRLSYRIECDDAWRTVSASVQGWVGDREIDVRIRADAGRWTMNGRECPRVEGCVDVDLNFSPSTNLLPIRRLGLAVGEHGPVSAAWLRFPSFELERLDQVYRRLADDVYRYESADGAFTRDLTVDAAGFPTEYPDFWTAETSS